MNENGKRKTKMAPIVERIREAARGNSAAVLLDMLEARPCLRVFLLGQDDDEGKAPGGSISIAKGARGVVISLRIPALGVEAHYEVDNWTEIWNGIELDLESGNTAWRPDYKQRVKENRAYSDLVG